MKALRDDTTKLVPVPSHSPLYREELIVRHVAGKDVLDCGLVGGWVDKDLSGGIAVNADEYWKHVGPDWLHDSVARAARSCVGVDIQESEVRAIRSQSGHCVVVADVEALPFHESFDAVLAGELVEHLHNMGRFLESVWRSLRNGGELLITTPNNYSLSKSLYAAVLGKEVCHPEHTCYYSFQTLSYMLAQKGFVVEQQMALPRQARTRLLSALYRWTARWRPTLCETIFVVARKNATTSPNAT